MPGREVGRHANGGMHQGIRLLTDTHKELAHNVSFPCQLCGIGNMLPLTTTVGEQGIGRINSFGCRPEYLQQVCSSMAAPFFDDIDLHTLTRDTAGNEE